MAGEQLNTRARQRADRFLAETYGFDAATRSMLIARGSADILRHCRELLEHLDQGDPGRSAQVAHRLKGNLIALGLPDLAELAGSIETRTRTEADPALAHAGRELWRALTVTAEA